MSFSQSECVSPDRSPEELMALKGKISASLGNFRRISEHFALLAGETRLKIIALLDEVGELCLRSGDGSRDDPCSRIATPEPLADGPNRPVATGRDDHLLSTRRSFDWWAGGDGHGSPDLRGGVEHEDLFQVSTRDRADRSSRTCRCCRRQAGHRQDDLSGSGHALRRMLVHGCPGRDVRLCRCEAAALGAAEGRRPIELVVARLSLPGPKKTAKATRVVPERAATPLTYGAAA